LLATVTKALQSREHIVSIREDEDGPNKKT
jgi:hypothetical protein